MRGRLFVDRHSSNSKLKQFNGICTWRRTRGLNFHDREDLEKFSSAEIEEFVGKNSVYVTAALAIEA